MLPFLLLFPIVFASVDEYRLLQYLKENYDHFERPIDNSSKPLDVNVRFLLNQIMDVDEKNQVMSILAYVDYHWTDYKMTWDPKRFGGIRDVRFHGGTDAPFRLWRPDILLFNSVSESFDSTYASRFIVNYDGHIQQNPPGIFRFICQVDMTYYPFDSQTCFLKLGSWTYSGNYINLDFMIKDMIGIHGQTVNAEKINVQDSPGSYFVNESIDLQVFLPNGEWDLLNTPGKRVVKDFGEEAYHELYYYIHVKRRTLAYGINLIIPSLVISMMTVLGFTLPPEAGEKMTLETTVLLSVIFFLQMVSNMSPPHSKSVPILAAFFSCCLMVVSCSCVFTVLVLSLYNRKPESHEMGPFVINKTIAPVHRVSTIVPLLRLPRPSTTVPAVVSKIRPSVHLKYFEQFVEQLKDVGADLEKMKEKVEENYKHEIEVSEWRFAAMAVDRLCLYLFTLFITVSTCGIILPHIIDGEVTSTKHYRNKPFVTCVLEDQWKCPAAYLIPADNPTTDFNLPIVMLLFAYLVPVVTGYVELNFTKSAAFSENVVEYHTPDGTVLEGFLVVPRSASQRRKRPAVILFHAFTGRGDFDDDKAIQIAKMGYVAFAADTYGKDFMFTSLNQSFAMMGEMMENRTTTLQDRILAAWRFVNNLSFVDKNRIASIGFCYGGLCSLDLARYDVGAKAVVAFHPDVTNYPGEIKTTRTAIQVHHGDADLFTTNDQADNFVEELRQRKTDWQFLRYGSAEHAFTLPGVDDLGLKGTSYNPKAARRAWAAMEDFLKETLA